MLSHVWNVVIYFWNVRQAVSTQSHTARNSSAFFVRSARIHEHFAWMFDVRVVGREFPHNYLTNLCNLPQTETKTEYCTILGGCENSCCRWDEKKKQTVRDKKCTFCLSASRYRCYHAHSSSSKCLRFLICFFSDFRAFKMTNGTVTKQKYYLHLNALINSTVSYLQFCSPHVFFVLFGTHINCLFPFYIFFSRFGCLWFARIVGVCVQMQSILWDELWIFTKKSQCDLYFASRLDGFR